MSADIISIERGLQVILGELMGTPGTGTLVVRSTSGTVSLPAGSFALPIIGGQMEESGAVFVSKNPATEDGSWLIDTNAEEVAIEAMQGGTVGNHPPGTQFRWFPTIPGIEELAEGTTDGGVNDSSFGAVRQLRTYRSFGKQDWQDFYSAQLGDFPGIALTWTGLGPADGPNFAAPGPRTARMGSRGILYRHHWGVWLVTSRVDGEGARRGEAMVLHQRVADILQGRTGARGIRVSTNPGITVISGRPVKASPESYVDEIVFDSTFVRENRSATGANPWLTTRLQVPRRNDDGDVREPLVPSDVTIMMDGSDAEVGARLLDETGAPLTSGGEYLLIDS